MVPAPSASSGEGPARSAHETLGRTLQLLWSERQHPELGPSGLRHGSGLVQMAAPSQPAYASHVGAVQSTTGAHPASPAACCGEDMGRIATSRISGGAGWWKSPCPVLVRASGEQSPGATRHHLCRSQPLSLSPNQPTNVTAVPRLWTRRALRNTRTQRRPMAVRLALMVEKPRTRHRRRIQLRPQAPEPTPSPSGRRDSSFRGTRPPVVRQ